MFSKGGFTVHRCFDWVFLVLHVFLFRLNYEGCIDDFVGLGNWVLCYFDDRNFLFT